MHFEVNFFSDCISLKTKSKGDTTRCHHSRLQSFISGITDLKYACEPKVNIIPYDYHLNIQTLNLLCKNLSKPV